MRLALLFAGVVLAACAQQPFAPNLAAKGAMYRATQAPDGTLYFFKKVSDGHEDYRIFTSRRDSTGSWTDGERLNLGGDYSDLYPAISSDGTLLVFSSYRPVAGAQPNGHIWFCTRTGKGWSEPRYAASVNEPGHYHSALMLDADKTLRFFRATPDYRTSAPMVAKFTGDGFSTAQVDRAAAEYRGQRGDRYYWGILPAPDRMFALVFISEIDAATKRRSPSKTFIALPAGAGWTEPRLLPDSINSLEPNFWMFTPDGKHALFTSAYTSLYRIATADLLAR